MKIKIRIVTVVLFFCISFTSCGAPKSVSLNSRNNADIFTSTVNPVVLIQEKYYEILVSDNNYSYHVFDKNGKAVKKADTGRHYPNIKMVDNSIVGVQISYGTGYSTNETFYYDTNNNKFSETFSSVLAVSNKKLAYYSTNHEIVVQDIFDKQNYYKIISSFNYPLFQYP